MCVSLTVSVKALSSLSDIIPPPISLSFSHAALHGPSGTCPLKEAGCSQAPPKAHLPKRPSLRGWMKFTLPCGEAYSEYTQALSALLITMDDCQVNYHSTNRKWLCVDLKMSSCLYFVVRSYLQVHQLELDSLGQQIRENKRNGRLVRTHVVEPVTPVLPIIQIPPWPLSSVMLVHYLLN